jgi:hypothetical protein
LFCREAVPHFFPTIHNTSIPELNMARLPCSWHTCVYCKLIAPIFELQKHSYMFRLPSVVIFSDIYSVLTWPVDLNGKIRNIDININIHAVYTPWCRHGVLTYQIGVILIISYVCT